MGTKLINPFVALSVFSCLICRSISLNLFSAAVSSGDGSLLKFSNTGISMLISKGFVSIVFLTIGFAAAFD